eukprot:GILI01013532.1.p1 GENE.GILI01013532.1~~GILI01013532.1.p1  ORF type:complete len:348 (+),score=95.95 GILI01013532.1:137-1180(+)
MAVFSITSFLVLVCLMSIALTAATSSLSRKVKFSRHPHHHTSPHSWLETSQRFSGVRYLGKEDFGEVFLARDSKKNEEVAVKIFSKDLDGHPMTLGSFLQSPTAQTQQYVHNECQVPRLVQQQLKKKGDTKDAAMFSTCHEDVGDSAHDSSQPVMLVFDPPQGSSLKNVLHLHVEDEQEELLGFQQAPCIPPADLPWLARRLLDAASALQTKLDCFSVTHNDLHPSNIFWNGKHAGELDIHIIDWGDATACLKQSSKKDHKCRHLAHETFSRPVKPCTSEDDFSDLYRVADTLSLFSMSYKKFNVKFDKHEGLDVLNRFIDRMKDGKTTIPSLLSDPFLQPTASQSS